jgi:hypothetical protein
MHRLVFRRLAVCFPIETAIGPLYHELPTTLEVLMQ